MIHFNMKKYILITFLFISSGYFGQDKVESIMTLSEYLGYVKNYHPVVKQANLVIKSPGIPDKVPVIKRLKALNINIIDEIEFIAFSLKI